MKLGLNIVGVLLTLIGLVWFFQGINVLKGSGMSGETQWALIGILAVIIGGGLLYYNRRRVKV